MNNSARTVTTWKTISSLWKDSWISVGQQFNRCQEMYVMLLCV